MPKAIFFTDIPPEITALFLEQAPPSFEVGVYSSRLSDDEKISLLKDANFAILFPGRISERVLRSAPHLKLIQLVSAGYEGMDLSLCRELGVPVANNGGANAIDVAEHTIGLILSFYRHFSALDQSVREGRWNAINAELSAYTIHGKTAGVIGLGNIGRRVALLLKAFGAQVLYYDDYAPPLSADETSGLTQVSLSTLLAQVDIVTLHVPLTPETKGLIGRDELAAMKPTALLVNTCRGRVVDEVALIEALQRRQILGAALDVFDREPPAPDNPLLKLDNVLLTPHVAGATYDTWERRGKFVFENLQRVWGGQPPLAVVSAP